jgi:transposase
MVSAEGIESTKKRKFNDMQGHGWHETRQKALIAALTDRKTDCKIAAAVSRAGGFLALRRKYSPENLHREQLRTTEHLQFS